ncbi:uncharacterized protein LOC144578627 isoform X4 [Callithrix jacchus]
MKILRFPLKNYCVNLLQEEVSPYGCHSLDCTGSHPRPAASTTWSLLMFIQVPRALQSADDESCQNWVFPFKANVVVRERGVLEVRSQQQLWQICLRQQSRHQMEARRQGTAQRLSAPESPGRSTSPGVGGDIEGAQHKGPQGPAGSKGAVQSG